MAWTNQNDIAPVTLAPDFEVAASEQAWLLNDSWQYNMAFGAIPSEWGNHSWNPTYYIMAAEEGAPGGGGQARMLLLGV